MVQKNTLHKDLYHCIIVELRHHLSNVKQYENSKLGGVNNVPHICEISKSLLFELNQFKHEEEYLSEQAHGVSNIKEQLGVSRQRNDEWNHESEQVKLEHQFHEPLGSDELEVNNLSDGFKIVKVNLIVCFNAENACQMLVIEVDIVESILLNISNLLSDDNLLEINQ